MEIGWGVGLSQPPMREKPPFGGGQGVTLGVGEQLTKTQNGGRTVWVGVKVVWKTEKKNGGAGGGPAPNNNPKKARPVNPAQLSPWWGGGVPQKNKGWGSLGGGVGLSGKKTPPTTSNLNDPEPKEKIIKKNKMDKTCVGHPPRPAPPKEGGGKRPWGMGRGFLCVGGCFSYTPGLFGGATARVKPEIRGNIKWVLW